MTTIVRQSRERSRIMNDQHWTEVLNEIDEMMEGVGLEFAKAYLDGINPMMVEVYGPVTDEQAQKFLEELKEKVAFDRKMIEFVKTVGGQTSGSVREVFLSSKMLEWIKITHQKYPRLKMYQGARKMTHRKKTARKLYGISIVIDESLVEPSFW